MYQEHPGRKRTASYTARPVPSIAKLPKYEDVKNGDFFAEDVNNTYCVAYILIRILIHRWSSSTNAEL